MNIAFEHETSLAGHASGRDGEEFMPVLSPLDWFALRSRLFAAHDLRGVLDAAEVTARITRRGSFAGSVAHALHAYEPVPSPVNRNASANGKPEKASLAFGAGGRSTGARG